MANRIRLTQLAADRLRAKAKEVVYWDNQLPGFGLRVSPKGRKTFIAMYRVRGGKEVMETIGTLAIMSVADAREHARRSMVKARAGIDPRDEKKAAEAARAAAKADAFTFSKLVDDFMDKHAKRRMRPSSIYETRRLLNRALPYLGEKPARDIAKADILLLVNAIESKRQHKWEANKKDGPLVEANAVLRTLRTCFTWGISEDLLAANPTAGVKSHGRPTERDRVLNDSEVVAFWQACDQLGWPYGRVFQLLLVTGQRLREVGELSWSEFDLENRVWHLPRHRAKNDNAHDVHLSDLALEIINGLPRVDGFIFSANGQKAPVNYSDAKRRADLMMRATLPKLENWTLHDLRRTAATGMAEIGIAPHVLDRVLNHVSGTIKGVARIYNRFEYRDERKTALDAWGRFVETLVRPDAAEQKVIELRPRA